MSTANFIPRRNVITGITNALNGVVTAVNHGYATGEYVRINIPSNYGMRLGRILSQITVINVNTFFLNVCTLFLDAFVVPGAPFTPAEVLPISEMTDNIAI